MKSKKLFATLVAVLLVFSVSGCRNSSYPDNSVSNESYPDAHILQMDGNTARLDGDPLVEFDYTWRAAPSMANVQFEGTAPDENLPAYIAHDIIYFPEISESDFAIEEYDGEREWVTRYTVEGLQDYIFGTLPVLGTEFPSDMMHTESEAYNNPVIHISEPGKYILEGSFNGQLFFDFGDEEETFSNNEASVTVILNGAEVTCSVAPAIVFHDVYECDNNWENRENYTDITDLSEAGVKIIIADGTENSFTGCNVYRLLKAEYKKSGSTAQKKLWKTDGAFYSFQSIEFNSETNGTGILNITSNTFEGLDSELHMTINGGYINIFSQDDGINVNEDDVSVFTLNDGHLTIFASLGSEGDVIDSNGYIRINGGVLAGTSKSPSDDLLDSGSQTYIGDNATIIYGGSMSSGREFNDFEGVPQPNNDRRFGEEPPEKPDGAMGEPPDMPLGDMNEPPEKPSGNMGEPPEKPMGDMDEPAEESDESLTP